MYMKVFPHGRGNGSAPTRYLVRPDYPGRDAHPPEVLRGDVERTRALIDSLDTTWRFTAGGSFLASRRYGNAGTGTARYG